jgi:hypothetical protein
MPVPSGYKVTTTGHCDGILNGKRFNGPTSFFADANMKTPMGCIIGGSIRGAPAYMRFARGRLDVLPNRPKRDRKDLQLDVVIDEMNINLLLPTHLEGVYRGHAVGMSRFLIKDEEMPELMRKCAAEGIDGLPFAFEFDTAQEMYG